MIFTNNLLRSQSDGTTDKTTSHLTDKTTSHSTRLSKDDNQVAGYNPAKDAGQVIGYSHSTDETPSHSTRLSKNDNQVAGYKSPKNDNQVAGYAASRARSLLCAAVVASATGTARPIPCGCAYLSDMPRRSLMKQLAIRLSQQAGKSLVMRGSLHLGLLATVLWGNR
jgi:hypothetical protein